VLLEVVPGSMNRTPRAKIYQRLFPQEGWQTADDEQHNRHGCDNQNSVDAVVILPQRKRPAKFVEGWPSNLAGQRPMQASIGRNLAQRKSPPHELRRYK